MVIIVLNVLLFHIWRMPMICDDRVVDKALWASVLTAPNLSVLSSKETSAFISCFKFILILLKSTQGADRRSGDSTAADLSWGNDFLPKLPLICSYGGIHFYAFCYFMKVCFPTFASDLVSFAIPRHQRVECMTCCILTCMAASIATGGYGAHYQLEWSTIVQNPRHACWLSSLYMYSYAVLWWRCAQAFQATVLCKPS